MPAKASNGLSANPFQCSGFEDGLVNGLRRTRSVPDQFVSAVGCADLQQCVGTNQLVDQGRAQGATREDVAIADTTSGVDDEQGIIEVKTGALEAIVHDDEVASRVLQGLRTGQSICAHDHRCMPREQHRLVADVAGTVMIQINAVQTGECAAIATRNNAWLETCCSRRLRKRYGCRRFACSAQGKITYAQYRHRYGRRFGPANTPSGNHSIYF